MCLPSSATFNQLGLVIGFIGSILLALSGKVGVISKGGSVYFHGLDPMNPADENLKRVERSHWRNRYFTPIGWGMLAFSFFMQLVATFQ